MNQVEICPLMRSPVQHERGCGEAIAAKDTIQQETSYHLPALTGLIGFALPWFNWLTC